MSFGFCGCKPSAAVARYDQPAAATTPARKSLMND
jgi:hypothetical protein